MKRKKILIAGGSGMIGVSLTNRLKNKKNFQLISSYYRNQPQNKSNYKKLNFSNYSTCLKSTKNIETLYLLTMVSQGIMGIKSKEIDFVFKSLRVNLNLIEAAVKNNVKKIIFLSSSTIYQPSNKPISESKLDINKDPYEIYLGLGWYFRYIEKILGYLDKKKIIKTNIIRTGAVYGKYDSLNIKKARVVPSLIMRMIKAKRTEKFEIWGNSKIVRDFVFAEDVAKVLEMSMYKNFNKGPVNFSSGKGVTILSLAKLIDKILKKKLNFQFNPNLPTSVKYRVLSNKLIDSMKIMNISRTSLQKGIKETINWYKNYEN